jgi:hypothetical protein
MIKEYIPFEVFGKELFYISVDNFFIIGGLITIILCVGWIVSSSFTRSLVMDTWGDMFLSIAIMFFEVSLFVYCLVAFDIREYIRIVIIFIIIFVIFMTIYYIIKSFTNRYKNENFLFFVKNCFMPIFTLCNFLLVCM